MIRLFGMILMAPFWVHFLLAGGVVGIGHYIHDSGSKGYAEKIRLSQATPPEVMSIIDFQSDAPRSFPVEVNLRAQIAIDHNVNLVRTKNDKTVGERAMYILVAPDAAPDTKVAYGAVILQPSEVDLLGEWAETQVSEGGMLGPILTFDGLVDHPYDTSHIMDALQNQGFTAAPSFVYVDPFLTGREAGLAIKPRDKPLDIVYTYYIAAFFVLLGVLKFGLRLRRKGQGAAAKPSVAPLAVAAPMAAETISIPEPMPAAQTASHALPELASNDFIGALARKAAASAAKASQPIKLTAAIAPDSSKGNRSTAARSHKLRGAAGLVSALAMYLVFASFGGSFGLPNVQAVTGFFGSKAAVTEIIMTEVAPVAASALEPAPQTSAPEMLAPEMLVSETPVVQTQAAPAAVAVSDAAAALPTATPAKSAMDLVAIQAKATQMFTLAKVQIAYWRAAPPKWLLVSLLAPVLLLLALFILRNMGALRGARSSKLAENDPFERLLRRRLAEKGRAEKPVMMGMGFQRA